jgi:beta-galactosidase
MFRFLSTWLVTGLLVAVAGSTTTVAQPTGNRTSYTINDNWKFYPGGMEYADQPKFNDAQWQTVSLPHTWNAEDPFDDDETYARGIGWYRKVIELDKSYRNKKIWLCFEGANQVTDVYVNGVFAGQHKGGYTAFSIDITPNLNWKNEVNKNLIAVQVNNAHDNFIVPLSVGFALYGGIYRNVWLTATDELHFKEINNAAGGIFIHTPVVNNEEGSIRARTTVVNESDRKRKFLFSNTVYDAAGNKVTSFEKEATVERGAELSVDISSATIPRPRLWSPEDPYLYKVNTQIIENGTVIDEVNNPLGFRWFRFDADSGFFLNGKKYILHGTNRHQDMEGKGSALTAEDHIRDMQMIRNMGVNFLRLAHYPQAPLVLDLADRLGLIIWEEIPVVNYMNLDPAFLLNAENMLREMIHQHYNHPAVVMWGSMNEILLHGKNGDRIQKHDDSVYVQGIRKFALPLDSLIRAEDSTRYTTLAMHGSGDYAKYKLDDISQVDGYNIYSGWYSGKLEDFGNWLDRQHKNYPKQILFISEYGAEGEVKLNTEKPLRMDYTGQYQRLYHESYLRQINQRSYLAGTAIWSEFDFSQPNIGGPAPHKNQKGLVTWNRQPKDAYYLYKANWNPEPMVYIATRNWLTRAGEAGVSSSIEVYSNLDEVTLYVSGTAQPVQKCNDIRKATWQVKLQDGKNTITASGIKNGKSYHDEIVLEYRVYQTDLTIQKIFQPVSVNVGSDAQYADPSGTIWIEDRPWQKGSFGYVSGNSKMFARTKVITDTKDVPLYYSYLDSVQAYRFDVKDGEYKLTLCFAEGMDIQPGERIFDVLVNDSYIIKGLDLSVTYGYARAVKKIFVVKATDGKGIAVSFQAKKGNTTLSGIRLEQ